MNAGEPQLSIVIPVYNNWWLTERCLRALEQLRAGCSIAFETIVVDNASTDETPAGIGGFPWVRSTRNERNRNFAGACNDGAALARADVVLFLNNDAYPIGDALPPLVAAFDRPEVAIAGGALLYEDGVTQAAGLVALPNAHWHHFCRNLPASLPDVKTSRDSSAMGGAAMAVRARWFLESGGFDETFVNGFEDVDLCMRARADGKTIAYVAESAFAHYEAASEGRFDREEQNERRFYERWSSVMGNVPRMRRGDVGAIVVRSGDENDLTAAARKDLERALQSFGHPVVRQRIAALRRLDRRFRRAATLGWFEVASSPAVILRRDAIFPTLHTVGSVQIAVPWMPCAARERADACALRRSADERSLTVAVCEGDLQLPGYRTVKVTPRMLLGGEPKVDVACVVHCGLTDDAAFGNIVLAQAGIPAVVLDGKELRPIFADDVALITPEYGVESAVRAFAEDAALRERYGLRLAADARRRFSPRRTAIRVVDLLCAARFGLERRGTAAANTPLRGRI